MGLIADMVDGRKGVALGTSGVLRSPADRGPGRELWDRIFGVAKEDGAGAPEGDGYRPVRGGSWGRGTIANPGAFKRLLQAMRSMAPGGWSDDRWEQSRHFEGIQYLAIHRPGMMLSQAEFQVFRKAPGHPEGKVPVKQQKDKEAWKLVDLLEKPNEEDSFGDLMYRWWQQMNLTGKGLTWVVPSKAPSRKLDHRGEQMGLPMELYSIPTALAIPQPAINPDYPDGYYRIQPVYPYGPFSSYPTPATAVGAPIPAQWMMTFKFPHPLLRYDGFSPLTALRLHIDEVTMMDRSRHYSMRKSIRPNATLDLSEMDGSTPWDENEIERVRAEFENEWEGPENHGKLFIPPPGGRLEPFGTSPVDMDYQAGWDQLVSFVLAGFGITKPAAGMTEDSSYSTLFATLKQLYWLTLDPFTNLVGSKLTRFLAPYFGEDLIVEVRCRRIDDHDVRIAKANAAMNAKAITKNQFLMELDYPTTEEEWGEEMAGTDPQQEQQPGMPGMPGAEGQPGAPPQGQPQPGQEQPQQEGMGGDEDLDSLLGELGGEEEGGEIEAERPSPGKLSQGALGPRKSLNRVGTSPLRHRTKSMYQQMMEITGNGHH